LVKNIVTVTGKESEEMARRLGREEGIFAGVSSGANVAVAVRLAGSHLGTKVVAILPDGGDRYISTGLFD